MTTATVTVSTIATVPDSSSKQQNPSRLLEGHSVWVQLCPNADAGPGAGLWSLVSEYSLGVETNINEIDLTSGVTPSLINYYIEFCVHQVIMKNSPGVWVSAWCPAADCGPKSKSFPKSLGGGGGTNHVGNASSSPQVFSGLVNGPGPCPILRRCKYPPKCRVIVARKKTAPT
ncbi:Protein of unknown function [Gryllus bimaculatus]|nr:Protein of unknown function [Gryllus bimaculatus]